MYIEIQIKVWCATQTPTFKTTNYQSKLKLNQSDKRQDPRQGIKTPKKKKKDLTKSSKCINLKRSCYKKKKKNEIHRIDDKNKNKKQPKEKYNNRNRESNHLLFFCMGRTWNGWERKLQGSNDRLDRK